MARLSEKQLEMYEFSQWDFADLNAVFLSCTLKRSPEMSYAQGLIDISKAIIEKRRIYRGATPSGLRHHLRRLL